MWRSHKTKGKISPIRRHYDRDERKKDMFWLCINVLKTIFHFQQLPYISLKKKRKKNIEKNLKIKMTKNMKKDIYVNVYNLKPVQVMPKSFQYDNRVLQLFSMK